MSKTTKILLLFLAIVVIGGGIYFTWRNYRTNKQTQTEDPWEAYNQYLRQTTVMGTVKEISDNKITVTKDDGEEAEYSISENTIYEKLGEPSEDGSAQFVTATKDDLAKDQSIWLFFEGEDNNTVAIIKIINSDNNNLPTPNPSST
jgi:preprotein translocase subunit YajC